MNLPKLDSGDKYFFASSIITPIVIWWLFFGRQKYSVKGMR